MTINQKDYNRKQIMLAGIIGVTIADWCKLYSAIYREVYLKNNGKVCAADVMKINIA